MGRLFVRARSLPAPRLFPSTTLFRSPREGAPGDEPWQERVDVPQPLEALGAPDHAGVLPERAPNLRRSPRSEEHTSELQSLRHLVCRLPLEKQKKHNATAGRVRVRAS